MRLFDIIPDKVKSEINYVPVEDNDFRQQLSQLNLFIKENNPTEHILDEDAVKAILVLNYISYCNTADLFLGISSLNLLNAYIKQADSKISYKFHKYLDNIIKGIEDINCYSSLKICYNKKYKINYLIFNFWDFQFSFHFSTVSSNIENLENSEIEWDGIKKQPCAKLIFDYALNNTFITNMTVNRKQLKEFVEDEYKKYENLGNYYFDKGSLYKDKDEDINSSKVEEDKHLKNFVRTELFNCQDRPVILSGHFKRIWDKHVTFTTIRPYIKGVKTYTICDHINLYKADVEKYINLDYLVFNNKYYFIGCCERYENEDRMGIRLADDLGVIPIFKPEQLYEYNQIISTRCHVFDLDKFAKCNQKVLL